MLYEKDVLGRLGVQEFYPVCWSPCPLQLAVGMSSLAPSLVQLASQSVHIILLFVVFHGLVLWYQTCSSWLLGSAGIKWHQLDNLGNPKLAAYRIKVGLLGWYVYLDYSRSYRSSFAWVQLPVYGTLVVSWILIFTWILIIIGIITNTNQNIIILKYELLPYFFCVIILVRLIFSKNG